MITDLGLSFIYTGLGAYHFDLFGDSPYQVYIHISAMQRCQAVSRVCCAVINQHIFP